MQHDVLEWPDEKEPLPPLTLKLSKAALFSFANGTGLGWDVVHPRAYQWIALLLKCERSVIWPVQVGIVVVVLLPNQTAASARSACSPTSPGCGCGLDATWPIGKLVATGMPVQGGGPQ